MERRTALAKILEEEYGITTAVQLKEAIKNLPPLDISVFVAPMRTIEKESRKEKTH